MSTFISLVVVGVCVVATTWLVVRDGGKPATHASGGHRAVPSDRVPRATAAVDRPDQGPGEATSAPATLVAEPEPEPEPVAEPEPEPEPEPEVLAPEPAPQPAVVVTSAVTTTTPVAPVRRGARARAPERVRARRRDHVHLGDPDRDAVVLVSPADLPEPLPPATRPTERMRAGLGLIVMLVTFGITAAVILGVVAILIADLLENAVK